MILATGSAGIMEMGSIILIWGAMFGGLYFFLIRPQRKEQRRVTAMIGGMEVGDTVLTTSGFYGVVIDITGEDIIVEFGNNKNCRIPMQKKAVAQVEKTNA